MNPEILKIFNEDRGTLVPVEFADVPFVPKRLFFIKGVPQGTVRGEHGHFKCKQYYICIKGLVLVEMYTGPSEFEVVILRPGQAILVPEMVWTSEEFCTGHEVLLVLCSEEYSKDDYFTDKNLLNLTPTNQ